MRAWHKNHPGAAKVNGNKIRYWYLDNPQKAALRNKLIGDRLREWYKDNPEKSLRMGIEAGCRLRRWHGKHAAQYREIMKLWCLEHPEAVAERGKKTRGVNHRLWKGGSVLLRKKIEHMPIYRQWARRVRVRDVTCRHCGSRVNLHVHHIVPMSMILAKYGITSTLAVRECCELWSDGNGLLLCKPCHETLHQVLK
jgi:hypothetical protein